MTDDAPERLVYFLQSQVSGAIKVGSSIDQPRRQGEVQTGNHERLVVLGTCAGGRFRESAIKAELRAHWTGGGTEWFFPTAEVAEVVARCLAETYAEEVRARVLGGPTGESPKDAEAAAEPDVVERWLDDDVMITGDCADGFTTAEMVSSFNGWAALNEEAGLALSRNALVRLLEQRIVWAGGEWDKHTRRIVRARIC